MFLKAFTGFAILAVSAGSAFAGQLVYQPVNPSFGGSPLNGSWLLAQGQAQAKDSGGGGGAGTGGFVIDFPDFGNIAQPTTPTDPQTQPSVPTTVPSIPGT